MARTRLIPRRTAATPPWWLLEVALVVVIGVLIARIALSLVAVPLPVVDMTTMAAGSNAGPVQRRAVDHSSLYRVNPFYRETLAAEPVQVPETRLNLKLTGIRSGENPAAFLILPNATQGVFRPGQVIIEGVTLEVVSEDRVELLRNGAREVLYLEGAQRPAPAASTQSVSTREGSSLSPQRSAIRAADATPTMLESPEAFFDAITLRPVVVDGERRGFAVYPRGDGAYFNRAGLRSGDILLRINGRSLAGDADLASLVEALEGVRELTLFLQRGAQTQLLTVKAQ